MMPAGQGFGLWPPGMAHGAGWAAARDRST